jgi:CBS domain containing-hemolysin-like protein
LLFITITTLALWAAAAIVAAHGIAHAWPWYALAASFVALLFCAEVLPLLVAARRAEGVLMALGGWGGLVLRGLTPFLWFLNMLGRGLARGLGAGANSTTQVTPVELRTALAAAEEEGVIESEERAMLEGALSVREKRVRDVMTPRAQMIGVGGSSTLRDVLDVALHEGHSRLPVWEENGAAVAGVLATKDLLPHLRARRFEILVRDVMRPMFALQGDEPIAGALEALRRQRSLMAVVLEENGEVAGLVTLEDLLEEIVGEIEDEWDDEPQARIESTVDFNRTPEDMGETQSFALACDGEISVREAARVWREAGGGLLRLRDPDGTLVHSGDSLASLAARWLGDRVENEQIAPVGDAVITLETPEAEEPHETSARETQINAVELAIREVQNGVAQAVVLRVRAEEAASQAEVKR